MKHNLKKMFLNEIEKDKSLKYKYTQLAGFANPTALHKFLTEEEREMNNFDGLLNMVRYSFLDREKEIMDAYIRTLDPNGKCARVSLEYAICSRLEDLTQYLLNKLSRASNAESKEWAALYSLDRKVETGEVSPLESIDVINGMRLKTVEGVAYGNLLKIYGYQAKRIYDLMYQLSEGLELSIKKIKDSYIRQSYFSRLGLVMMNVHMHQNNVSEAKRYAYLVLDNTTQENLRFLAYLGLGNIYTFESLEKSIDYLNQARLIGKTLANNEPRMLEVERSLNFVRNYWGVQPEHINYQSENISDIHEVAFYYIRSGKIEEAKEILFNIDLDKLNPYNKGFHFFYRGLITNNKEDFYKSIFNFKEVGEVFYRNISLIELKKMGENPELLKALSN